MKIPTSSDRPDGKSKLPPPRNYLSRREQFRLLLMFGSLMLVLILMNEARNPKYWAMFTGAADGQAEPAEDDADGEIDSHFAPPRTVGPERLPGEIVTEAFRFRPDGPVHDLDLARRRAEKDFWRQQVELLPWEQRRDLPRVLMAFRRGEPLREEDALRWETTLQTLDRRWQEYTQGAMDALIMDQRLRGEDRARWMSIIHELEKRWNERLRDALAAAADPNTLSGPQRAELEDFQALFDEMSLDQVRDGTVASRSVETNAWFRLFELLQQTGQARLAEADVPRVGYRQLFKQSENYRGRLVRVDGVARQAFRVRAPQNDLGIKEYYVFTIFPAGGPSAPMLIYCLDVPDGFPEVKDKDIDKEVTLLKEPVEFTGYFYKRCAYAAVEGTQVAPLILAKSPHWTPAAPETAAAFPSLWAMLAAVAGAALLGGAVSYVVYARHRHTPSQRYGPASRATPQQLAALRDAPLARSPAEAMARLAREAQSPGDKATDD